MKRDEALAAEAEAEAERRADEIDAAQRLWVLRIKGKEQTGSSVETDRKRDNRQKYSEPAAATVAAAETIIQFEKKDPERSTEREWKKRMRRLHGEDDTDRDIRVAMEVERKRWEKKISVIDDDGQFSNRGIKKGEDGSAIKESSEAIDLFDARGHIALFPEPVHKYRNKDSKGNDKTDTRDSLKRKRDGATVFSHSTKNEQKYSGNKDDMDNANGTRLMDALTDRRGAVVAPWYNKSSNDAIYSNTVEGKSGATDRTNHRYSNNDGDLHRSFQETAVVPDKTTASNDPLLMMRRAQSQIKRVEKQKQAIVREDYYYARTRKNRRSEKKRQREREREKGREYTNLI